MHEHHHEEGGGAGGRLAVVIAVNAIITAAEYIGGVFSGSLSLISDAGHNLTDTISLSLGYAGERISRQTPTGTYTFGYKRFEVMTALVNALSLFAIGVYILYEAIERLGNPQQISFSIMLPIAVLGLAGNAFSAIILHATRKESLNTRAAFLHVLYDALSSVAVIAAAVVIRFTGEVRIDLAVSAVIAVMIFWSSFNVIAESVRIFMQGAPAHIATSRVYERIAGFDRVAEVHGLHVWSINSTEVFLSCHICLAPTDENTDTDGLIREVNAMLENEFGIRHTALQVETRRICSTVSGECCR